MTQLRTQALFLRIEPTIISRMRQRSILFLDAHNDSRSQMAQAVLSSLAGDRLLVRSAGIAPKPIEPLAKVVVEGIGLTLDGQVSQSARDLLGKTTFNSAIIIGCPDEEGCPKMFLGAVIRQIWQIRDPALAPEVNRLVAFRSARDDIRTRVHQWWQEQGHVTVHAGSDTPRHVLIPKPNWV